MKHDTTTLEDQEFINYTTQWMSDFELIHQCKITDKEFQTALEEFTDKHHISPFCDRYAVTIDIIKKIIFINNLEETCPNTKTIRN